MNDLLLRIVAEHGTPCYVYLLDRVRQRVADLRAAFGGRFHLRYAVKSNPNPALLRWMRGQVDGLDISSGGELRRAQDAGWDPARLGFTGPAKRPWEHQAALEAGIGAVVLESLAEARALDQAAAAMGRRQTVLVRLAPRRVPRGFGVNMAGKPSQFGIDEEEAEPALRQIQRMPHLDLAGFHVYSGTQCLLDASIAENYEIFLDLFRRFAAALDLSPRELVFGSGLGIPYHEGDKPLDLAAVAGRVGPQLEALRAEPRFAAATLVLELGRYLVGEAGLYLTRVLATKRSRGIDIAICDGGMNHHLGACGHLGSVLHRNYRMFKASPSDPDAAVTPHELVGPLCTTIDTLGHGVKMPALRPGDVIAVECSGAYGLSASPIHFISHAPPKEILVETCGGKVVVEDVTEPAGR